MEREKEEMKHYGITKKKGEKIKRIFCSSKDT
jgi:hypothetical protein